MLGCMFSARLETKTELYKSMHCINDNVIGLLVERQITYFDKWEYTMQLFTYAISQILVKMSMIYTNC